MTKQAALVLIALGCWPLASGCAERLNADQAEESRKVRPADHKQGKEKGNTPFVGAKSCAAAGCHGAAIAAERPEWQTSFSVWMRDDKHRRAYQVLFEDQAKRIVALLTAGQEQSEQSYLKFLNENCVGCHATPVRDEQSLALGVSCESCHGAADAWVNVHTHADWPELSSSKKQELGFVDSQSMLARAETCVDCHVGSATTDPSDLRVLEVNHDLIAAGHPAMRFDFAAYLQAMPRHWRNRNESGADHWQAGKLAATAAALQLLRGRALRASGDSAHWPEFSEYDCFSCHRGLGNTAAGKSAADQRPPSRGKPRWGNWSLAMSANFAVPRETYTELRDEMERREPRAARVLLRLNKLQTTVDVAASDFRPQGERGLDDLRQLAEEDVDPRVSWEQAAQWSLAFQAVLRSLPEDALSAKQLEQDRRIRRRLFDDLLGFSDEFASPLRFNRQEYRQLREELALLLKKT